MSARIEPARPPYSPEIQAALDRIMPPGVPPLVLFTTLARDSRLYERITTKGAAERPTRLRRPRCGSRNVAVFFRFRPSRQYNGRGYAEVKNFQGTAERFETSGVLGDSDQHEFLSDT